MLNLKISGWQKMSNEERESYSKDLNLEKSLISIVKWRNEN